MKQILGVCIVLFLITWYSGIGSEEIIQRENKITYSQSKAEQLYKERILSGPISKYKTYFQTRVIEYKRIKTIIPFYYKKEIILDKGIEYWSQDKE